MDLIWSFVKWNFESLGRRRERSSGIKDRIRSSKKLWIFYLNLIFAYCAITKSCISISGNNIFFFNFLGNIVCYYNFNDYIINQILVLNFFRLLLQVRRFNNFFKFVLKMTYIFLIFIVRSFIRIFILKYL